MGSAGQGGEGSNHLRGKTVVVLIVDDDAGVAETLSEVLGASGHEAVVAGDAQGGLDILRSRSVDLILLDVILPGGLSGYAACETYKSLRPNLPVVIITGTFTSDADARLATQVGALGFLRKPFAVDQLLGLVRRATEVRQSASMFLFAFRCQECGAESRTRHWAGEARRVRCPNCGNLRVVGPEELTPISEPSARVPMPGGRRRILVVDSTEHFRLYLLDLLTEVGHYVVTARDGQEALRLAQEWVPDLVITDILLPGMDGIALCQQIKAHPRLRQTPVLTITSLKDDEYRRHGQRAGIDVFMTKPIRAEELFEHVQTLTAPSGH